MLALDLLTSVIWLGLHLSSVVDASTVYGCYSANGVEPDPGWSMAASLVLIDDDANCDGTLSTGSIDEVDDGVYAPSSGAPSVGAKLYNSAGININDPIINVINTFEVLIFSACTSSHLGYWYYTGNGKFFTNILATGQQKSTDRSDHTTGVVNYASSLKKRSSADSSAAVLNTTHVLPEEPDSPLDELHSSFGGLPNNGTFYVPFDGPLPQGTSISDYEVSLDTFVDIITSKNGQSDLPSTQPNALAVRSEASSLSTRVENSCTALGTVLDSVNGFRAFRITGVNWNSRSQQFSSAVIDGLANRIIGSAVGSTISDTVTRGVVASTSAMFLTINPLENRSWNQVFGLVTQSALNTIFFDIGTDMARNFYSEGVYQIADGAGNVVVNVVAWARDNWVALGDDY